MLLLRARADKGEAERESDDFLRARMADGLREDERDTDVFDGGCWLFVASWMAGLFGLSVVTSFGSATSMSI